MSEMEHKKGKLWKVLGSNFKPINIQDWLEMEYSVYLDQEVDQETAYGVLTSFFADEDLSCNYYIFNDMLYLLVNERTLDPYGFVEAKFVGDTIEVDAFYHNGGGDFSECIVEGLKKLENKL